MGCLARADVMNVKKASATRHADATIADSISLINTDVRVREQLGWLPPPHQVSLQVPRSVSLSPSLSLPLSLSLTHSLSHSTQFLYILLFFSIIFSRLTASLV